MAKVKKVKKAQNGDTTGRAARAQFIKDIKPKMESAAVDYIREKNQQFTKPVDTAARRKAIKEGKFREDPKTGDLFPVKKKVGGKVMAKKAKSGAALKKQAAVAIAMKKAGKAPKKAMGGMKMMKGGGKCKYGC
jgi:hypothetical protein